MICNTACGKTKMSLAVPDSGADSQGWDIRVSLLHIWIRTATYHVALLMVLRWAGNAERVWDGVRRSFVTPHHHGATRRYCGRRHYGHRKPCHDWLFLSTWLWNNTCNKQHKFYVSLQTSEVRRRWCKVSFCVGGKWTVVLPNIARPSSGRPCLLLRSSWV
jgi:hypothetical protein